MIRWFAGATALFFALIVAARLQPTSRHVPAPAADTSAASMPSPASAARIGANTMGRRDRATPSTPPQILEGFPEGAGWRPSQDAEWRKPRRELALESFRRWAGRYQEAPSTLCPALVEEGVTLARERRNQLRELITTDPELALAAAVPDAVRADLPSAVVAHLEEPVRGTGDLLVLAATPQVRADGSIVTEGFRPVFRTAVIGDSRYDTHVYGWRLDEPTRFGIALHGIAVDRELALASSPVRTLEDGELAAALAATRDPVCRISGSTAAALGTPTALAEDDQVSWVCGTEHARLLASDAVTRELALDTRGVDGIARPRSAHTEGVKRLLLIRVDFSDLVGAPYTDAAGTNMVNALDAFYSEQSYGKTGFKPLGAGSLMTATLRMPKTAAYYGSVDASQLRDAARAAAKTAGVDLSNFDFDLTTFGAVPGYSWAGLGYVGSAGAWIRASFDSSGGVPGHELGHNYGLLHANYYDTGGTSAVGPSGANVEYGDVFDTMGNATAGKRHFNTRYKNQLDWLPSTYVKVFSTNGVYRVFAMDATNATPLRAIRLARNSATNYWLEFRQKFTNNAWLMNGLGVRWHKSGQQTMLIDTTPGSADGKNDSPILIGRTFADREAGIYITPLGKGGTTPESLDVAIYKGAFTNNHAPVLHLTESANAVGPNAAVTFTAAATDADGDTLAYAWDFGDGRFGDNQPVVKQSWSAAGEYQVRCTISDMKGGETSSAVVIKVGSPTTVRVSGLVTHDGVGLPNIRVSVSNTHQTLTEADGSYTLVGLAKGSYSVKAEGAGWLFTRSGFTNPLNLQATRGGVNFEASAPGDLAQVTLMPLGAEWRFYDKGDLNSTAWRLPAFDDSTWGRGAAPLGYGDPDVVTPVGYGPDPANKYITTWYRTAFVVDDPSRFLGVTLGLMRDDGAVVYLNNTEVFRSNMPSGTITRTTLASSTVSGADETTVFETDLDPARFIKGTNVMAVEVHQSAVDSSDTKLAVQLTALLQPATSPTLAYVYDSGGLRLQWPVTASGFLLESADTPAPTAGWLSVDTTPQLSAGLYFVVLPVGDAQRFYRLRRP